MDRKNIRIFCGLAIVFFVALEFLNFDRMDALSYAVSGAALVDFVYDRLLWRLNFFEKTPKVYGVYVASVFSNYNGGTAYNSIIRIKQTLSSISVVEIMEDGCCESVTASISKTTPDGPWFLYYTYLTHPKLSEKDDMHYGTSILHILEDGTIDGGYFTNRNQQTAGNLTLKRISKRLR